MWIINRQTDRQTDRQTQLKDSSACGKKQASAAKSLLLHACMDACTCNGLSELVNMFDKNL